jgi:DNA-binding transcriptional MerR regulator
MEKTTWTLAELAEETGLSARTIRFYISRGLLEGPGTAGRGAAYGPGHVERLREIQRLQGEGRMLAEIAAVSDGQAELPEPVAWQQYAPVEGVVVNVRADMAPWRVRQIRNALARFAAEIKQEEGG